MYLLIIKQHRIHTNVLYELKSSQHHTSFRTSFIVYSLWTFIDSYTVLFFWFYSLEHVYRMYKLFFSNFIIICTRNTKECTNGLIHAIAVDITVVVVVVIINTAVILIVLTAITSTIIIVVVVWYELLPLLLLLYKSATSE